MGATAREPGATRAVALAGQLRVLVCKLRRTMREQTPPGDLTWSQVAALAHLERSGPATVTALARAEGVRPQSMGATVSDLEVAGLVSGSPDPGDGRQTLWSLTATARRWIKDFRAAREDWLCQAIQSRLTPVEQETLASAVELLERLSRP